MALYFYFIAKKSQAQKMEADTLPEGTRGLFPQSPRPKEKAAKPGLMERKVTHSTEMNCKTNYTCWNEIKDKVKTGAKSMQRGSRNNLRLASNTKPGPLNTDGLKGFVICFDLDFQLFPPYRLLPSSRQISNNVLQLTVLVT